MVSGVHLIIEGETFEDPKRNKRLVWKLNYLTITRLDIAHLVSVVNQYMFASTVKHCAIVEQILCYLKGASGCDILYSNFRHNIIE